MLRGLATRVDALVHHIARLAVARAVHMYWELKDMLSPPRVCRTSVNSALVSGNMQMVSHHCNSLSHCLDEALAARQVQSRAFALDRMFPPGLKGSKVPRRRVVRDPSTVVRPYLGHLVQFFWPDDEQAVDCARQSFPPRRFTAVVTLVIVMSIISTKI